MPNRALGRRARARCLAILVATSAAIAGFAALVGAWPILPFAGLEACLLWLAFRWMARHDGDFERLVIEDGRLRWESRCADRMSAFDAHTAWARLLVRDVGGQCQLALRYAGRTVAIGGLAAEPLRRRWAKELGCRIPVTHV